MDAQRRQLLKWLSTGVGMSALPRLGIAQGPAGSEPEKKPVVVIGGGFAGATFARSLRRLDPAQAITLVEPEAHYHCCPMGVEYLVGKREEASLTFGYEKLRAEGIRVIHQTARSLDAEQQQVTLDDGTRLDYERCVVATGIGYRYDSIAGYDEQIARRAPHAWGGADQLRTLRAQLQAMPVGGRVLIAAPPDDYRCPPGPYERASQIADYLKRHKPGSRVTVLDAKDRFAKQSQFEQAWTRLYGYGTAEAAIEWIGAGRGGKVTAIDIDNRRLQTSQGWIAGDVLNVIPAQWADGFSRGNGLAADHGWCPVDTSTLESLRVPNVHVIGDAAYAEQLPKSAFAATCQARVCALAIHSLAHGLPLLSPEYMNVCYSLCGDDYGISVMLHYQHNPANNLIEVKTLRVTPQDSPQEVYRREAQSAYAMFDSMVRGAFG